MIVLVGWGEEGVKSLKEWTSALGDLLLCQLVLLQQRSSTGWYVKCLLLTALKVGSPRPGWQDGWLLVKTLLQVADCQLIAVASCGWEQREETNSLVILIRAPIAFMRTPPSWPQPHVILFTSQSLYLLILSHCRDKVLAYNFWGDTNVQYMTELNPEYQLQTICLSLSITITLKTLRVSFSRKRMSRKEKMKGVMQVNE